MTNTDIEKMTAGEKKYLRAIVSLDANGRGIRCVALARLLQVRRSSVCVMVRRLAAAGFVEMERYGIVYLTAAGKEAARQIEEA
ncbi:metal-dependent transcriptional regulator [Galactobacillus timonensis]|uniref:metal-dependent transcriptional regulator n=1 Tax=Galactobacillus timonensis TaxID=2041840 RepID=UPI0010831959|nr:hypothetical protein [Galactobacillus timonensis]